MKTPPCAPPLPHRPPSPDLLAQTAAALGLAGHQIIAAQLLGHDPVGLGLLLDSAQTVLQLSPDPLKLQNLGLNIGVTGMESAPSAPVLIARSNREARAFGPRSTEPATRATRLEVRTFSAAQGQEEEPANSSFHTRLTQWLIADGHL